MPTCGHHVAALLVSPALVKQGSESRRRCRSLLQNKQGIWRLQKMLGDRQQISMKRLQRFQARGIRHVVFVYRRIASPAGQTESVKSKLPQPEKGRLLHNRVLCVAGWVYIVEGAREVLSSTISRVLWRPNGGLY